MEVELRQQLLLKTLKAISYSKFWLLSDTSCCNGGSLA